MCEKNLKNNPKMFIIIGDDNFIGNNMMQCVKEKNQPAHGYSNDEDVVLNIKKISIEEYKKNSDAIEIEDMWIVICLDPNMGFEKYVAKMKKICDDLDEMDYSGHICYFSLASICQYEYGKTISEESLVYPSSECDLCYATGENLLHLLSYSEKSYIEPHIFRVGVPYGENVPSFVNDMIETAKNNSEIQVPMGSDIKRTLTHIEDVCEAAIELMNLEFCPQLVNIAGETKTLAEVGKAVAEKYNVDFVERGLSPLYDQELSAELFNESITFNPKYNFNQWLNEQ